MQIYLTCLKRLTLSPGLHTFYNLRASQNSICLLHLAHLPTDRDASSHLSSEAPEVHRHASQKWIGRCISFIQPNSINFTIYPFLLLLKSNLPIASIDIDKWLDGQR